MLLFIRLDFDITVLNPTDMAGLCRRGANVGDLLTVTSPTGQSPPVLCGTLSGQHSKSCK